MYPILTIGQFSLPTYGVAMAATFILCGIWFLYTLPRHLLSTTDALNFYIIILSVTLFGSRIFGGIGQASFPALLITLLLIYGYCWRHQLPFLAVMDALVPWSLLTLTMLRLGGCFMAGCCYGAPTSLPWGIVFPPSTPAGLAFPGLAIHPTQLLYAIAALTGWLLTHWAAYYPLPTGSVANLGLGWLAFTYIPIGWLRGDQAHTNDSLDTGQWLALGILLGSVAILIRLGRKQ